MPIEVEELPSFLPNDDPSPETLGVREEREIFITRSNVLKSLISEFKGTDTLQHKLVFRFIGDNGKTESGKGSGVNREALISLFWKEFSIALSVGASEKVPCIRHDYQASEWRSAAKILTYGYKEESYFPIFLSRAFIANCLFGDNSVSKDCLLESFKAYVSKDEKETLEKCMSDDIDPEDDDVLELLSSYKCYRKPTKENIRTTLEELAHQELIQKPRYVANAWSGEFVLLKGIPQFDSFECLSAMYN